MRNRFLLGAGVAVAMAFSWANAQAQLLPMPGGPGTWYFGGEGGWTSLEDETGHAGAVGVRQRFNDGFNVGARAGMEFGPWRLEEEFRWQQAGQSRLVLASPTATLGPFLGAANATGGSFATRGNRDAYAFMTNAIYDFSFGGWPGLTPHLGAGVGAVILHDGVSIRPGQTGGACGLAGCTFASNTQVEFGYQGIAGIRYNVNPALAFDLDYRYLGATDPSFKTSPTFGGVKYTSGYSSHSLVASLSMRFGPPPPAPPVAPAPPLVARKVFLVFFDWDRDTITPEGHAIVQQAAAAFRGGAPVTIQVTGYTDASGSAGYNQRLSERRANNVANAMVKLGVPRQAMVVSGRGKNDQRVPTADGVREPQNRRVEILFP